MSKQDKVLEKLSRKPIPTIKWDELCGCLEHLGYELLKGDGSRRKFFHKEKNNLIICHEPHPSSDVAKGCLKDVQQHLTVMGFIKKVE